MLQRRMRTGTKRLTLTETSAIRAVRRFARQEGIRPAGRALAVIVHRFVGETDAHRNGLADRVPSEPMPGASESDGIRAPRERTGERSRPGAPGLQQQEAAA